MYQQEKCNTRAFGQAVKEARENKGWSREKLAEILDASPRHIQYIETREQHLSLQKFYMLAKLFSISIDEYILPDNAEGKDTRRRQLDAMLDNMNEKELSIVSATAKAIPKAKETGE